MRRQPSAWGIGVGVQWAGRAHTVMGQQFRFRAQPPASGHNGGGATVPAFGHPERKANTSLITAITAQSNTTSRFQHTNLPIAFINCYHGPSSRHALGPLTPAHVTDEHAQSARTVDIPADVKDALKAFRFNNRKGNAAISSG